MVCWGQSGTYCCDFLVEDAGKMRDDDANLEQHREPVCVCFAMAPWGTQQSQRRSGRFADVCIDIDIYIYRYNTGAGGVSCRW